MQIFLAALPIALLLFLMTILKWSGKRAGFVSWLAALGIAAAAFGLTPQVLWVSQLKGLLFSLYVLALLWPALLLYYLNYQVGGIQALTDWLTQLVPDRSMLVILLAWPFSSILEGIAGFGLPIAVAAPMLVSVGVSPLVAVVASAIGHSWSVTFGNMGVVFQSLVSLSGLPEAEIIPYAGLLMGLLCILCGLAAAHVLGELRRWKRVLLLGVGMGLIQYGLARAGLLPLSGLGASLMGVWLGVVLSRNGRRRVKASSFPRPLWGTLASYGGLAVLTLAVFIEGPIHRLLFPFLWRQPFPPVITRTGFLTAAGFGQGFRWFAHPGTLLVVTILLSLLIFARLRLSAPGMLREAAGQTFQAAFPATLGIIFTVGLSVLMDHTGMTQLLAEGLSQLTGRLFPLVSPLIGMLGTFATSSNTNSNVLFVSLQKQVAALIAALPVVLVAAQTAGGSLGSMIAPAKLIVGCSNVGLAGQEGQVLRKTLPYSLVIGLLVGLAALLLAG